MEIIYEILLECKEAYNFMNCEDRRNIVNIIPWSIDLFPMNFRRDIEPL